MSIESPYHFAHMLQVLKGFLRTLILYTLFNDFIHVYSPRASAENPWGQNFNVNRKALSLCPFVASFKEIGLKSDFIHIF